MRNIGKLLTLLLTLAVLVGAMTLSVSAAQFSEEDAFAYLDSSLSFHAWRHLGLILLCLIRV